MLGECGRNLRCEISLNDNSVALSDNSIFVLAQSPYSTAVTPTATGCSGLLRPRQCRYRDFQSLCYHSTCRRALLRQHRRLLNSSSSAVVATEAGGLELERPDERLFTCLTECVQRIREPFSPEEPLDTQAAETLEQEYNRMDTCIRRIIRVVKMLPYFNEIGKPAQLGLLRVCVLLSTSSHLFHVSCC